MKRLKIMKSYAVLWLFIYFLVYSNLEAMSTFFFATLTFNLAVLTVLVIGIIVIMKASTSLVMLAGTFGILAYKKQNLGFYLQGIDKIMPANIAHMFHSRAEKGVLLFTTEESRAVIEWLDEKFANQSRYINYFTGTALMIGLLGTFTGLLVAIDQMGKIILSLSGDIDLGAVIRSFAGPLGGMATGFGSSLFGVVTAIILGLMGYILNKNQEVFIGGVEDWLKGRIIDSAGATATTGVVTAGGGEELPEQRSSFMDIFIDNIASLTGEMAKIAQANERLHTITIESVQQARDEHELSYALFLNMNENLTNIDTSAKNNTNLLDTRLTNIENIITSAKEESLHELKQEIGQLSSTVVQTLNTNTMSLKEQSEKVANLLLSLDDKLKIQIDLLKESDSKERIELIREEVQNLSTILSKSDTSQSKNFENLVKSLSEVTQKLQSEMQLLESIEALHKKQRDDAQKQYALLETQTSNQELSLVTQNSTKELLEKQRVILELLIGKNDENLDELKRISSMNGDKPVTTAIKSIKTETPDRVESSDTKESTDKKSNGFFDKMFG